jgi:pyrroloquinoline-quinone synthase
MGVNELGELHLMSRRDLLDHSFYRRWVKGELSIDELQDYACQYAHAVAALPTWLRQAARWTPAHAAQLERHAVEEDDHLALWQKFVEALGVTAQDVATTSPNPATTALLRLGDELSGQPTGAAVAWALEAQTPAVSVAKLQGLKAHYGIDGQSGGEYFDVHSSRDLVHAAELETAIAGLGPNLQSGAQRTADAIIEGLWNLLTSVERAA